MAQTRQSSVWPVNENCEILTSIGTGSNKIYGQLSQDNVPTDATTGKVSIVIDMKATSPSADLMLFGNSNQAGANIGGADLIMDMQHPALGNFYGVRLMYANYNTSGTMTIDGAKVAPSPAHKTPAGNTLNWSAFVTFSGATSVTIPAATVGPGNNVIPTIVLSDLVAVTSIPRTDVIGAPPLLRVRSHVLANAVVYTAGGSAVSALPLNNASFNPGLVYANFNPAGTLAQLTTNTSSVLDPNAVMEPVGVVFSYASPLESLGSYGDSVMQGSGSQTSSFAGFSTRLTFMTYGTSRVISGGNYGVSGQKTADSFAIMKAHLNAGYRPTYVAIKPWSINDGVTQAAIDADWGLTTDAIEFIRSKGIVPIVLTSPPASGVLGAPWTAIKAVNQRVMSLPSWVIKADVAAVLNDPANDGKLLPIYDSGDGTHPSDAGHLAIANCVLSAIT